MPDASTRFSKAQIVIVSLCGLMAVIEGLDIQSMGVAAPGVAAEFGLSPAKVGLTLSASLLGMAIGAAFGGRLSDRLGRKAVLIASMAMLGVFSLATTAAWSESSLLSARLLTGLALGSAFPNLVALVSDVSGPRHSALALSVMYCGLPLGGVLAGLVALLIPHESWRIIFYLGGFAPLLAVPLLWWLLHDDPSREPSHRAAGAAGPGGSTPFVQVLFGARSIPTLLIWTSYFFTLLFVYLLLNWLPSFLVDKGLSRQTGSLASIALNIGAIIGSLGLGQALNRGVLTPTIWIAYLGMALSVAGLAVASGGWIFIAAFLCGAFVIGGQLVLYALTPHVYPVADRGAGVGAAVSVGRIGAILGPVMTGGLLGLGLAPGTVLFIAMPGLLIALFAAIHLGREIAHRRV